MSRSLLSSMIILTVVSVSMAVCFSEMVYAEDGGGADNDDWEHVSCDEANHLRNVSQCPDDDGAYGGASWHIFKTTNTPSLDQRGEPPQGRPVARTSVIGEGYPDSRGAVADVCKASKYEYYFAYVYDGWYGEGNWGIKPLIYWGPLDWGTYRQVNKDSGVVHIPIYHNANYNVSHKNKRDHTWSEVKAGLASGKNMNGWRMRGEAPLTYKDGASYESETMLKAWKVWSGEKNAKKIPNRTGFFCAGSPRTELIGVAVTKTGNSITTTNSETSKVVNKGNYAYIEKPSLPATTKGYTYVGWAESLDNAKVLFDTDEYI